MSVRMPDMLRAQRIDAPRAPIGTVSELAKRLRSKPRWLVLTGAGVSTDSGIPDYRDREGQWKRKQPIMHQAFIGDTLVRKRYWARSLVGWRFFGSAQPSKAHHRLADLEKAGWVQSLVTQNVDGLHQKAGSQRVIDLHGRISVVKCLQCGQRQKRADFQRDLEGGNPEFVALTAEIAPDGDADLDDLDFSVFQIPVCSDCGGTLMPDVVFYGGSVPRDIVQQAMGVLEEVDALLVV